MANKKRQHQQTETEQQKTEFIEDSIEFVTRLNELQSITSIYCPSYLLISSPAGYGKTKLLEVVRKKFQQQGWLSIYLKLSRGKDYSIQDLTLNILQRLNEDPGESLELKTSEECGYKIGKCILKALDQAQKKAVLMLIDEAEAFSEEVTKQFFNQFIQKIKEVLEDTSIHFRLICAGRYISYWKRLISEIELYSVSLTPFDFDMVYGIVNSFGNRNEVSMPDKYKKEFAAFLIYFTGGHPGCVTEILNANYGLPFDRVVSNEPKYYQTIVKPVIEQIRENIPPALREIFESLSVVRRSNVRLLQNLIDKGLIKWPNSEYELENFLLKTYFVYKSSGFLQNDITRHLLFIQLLKSDLSHFMKICEESISFYSLILRNKGSYRPDIIFIELLYQQLQYLVYKRNGSKKQFFEILDQSLVLLVSGRDHRAVIESVIELLNNDWEFRFTFNYLLRERAYNDNLFDELIEKIRNRAKILENIEKTHELDHWDALIFLGRVYLEKQQFEKSLEILEKAYQYNAIETQPFLLQALKTKADSLNDIDQQITLYERIHEIDPKDQTVFELQHQQVKMLKEQLKNIQGHANLEVKLSNRQEDLFWQNELVLKFEIKNKGNIPANRVSVQLSRHKAYKIIGDSLFQKGFITTVHPMELSFKIQPVEKAFTLTLTISYSDTLDGSIKEQMYEQYIQLSQEPQAQFERIDNPYRSGNLIQELQRGNTSMFYGRRETIQELKNILVDNDEGLVIIYGQRRTGKSCLMKYIEKKRCFGSDLLIVFTNIQKFSSEQDFYDDILSQVKNVMPSDQHVSLHASSFDEFTTSLVTLTGAANTPLLIMLDEFEYVTDTHFKYTTLTDADIFIRKFRDFIQYTPKMKFALAGADGLRAMINDYHNPLFKAGRTFHIAFLSPQDARALITEPLQDRVNYTEQAITSIQNVTANHPYYIQLLCQTIVWILNKKHTTTVTITEVNQAIEHIEKTGDSDFEYVWDISQKETHLILAIIAEEINGKKWVPIERIGEVVAELNVHIQEDGIDGAIKELLVKNLITESPTKLEYTIPMGLLHTWITRYKPLKKVRREFAQC